MSVIGDRCGLVKRKDIRAIDIKDEIRIRSKKVKDAMRIEVCFFFKKRNNERCEIFDTRRRRMESSAISR